MTEGSTHLDSTSEVAGEDRSRAQVYRLLSRFLSGPPDRELLDSAAALSGDDSDFGKAISGLAHLCARTDVEVAAAEYHDLFIGVGRGELVPYASYYLTGFLNEKPLAKLRNDMAVHGIERVSENRDPEDHVAALCEMMAGLIEGEYGAPRGLDEQKAFFNAHIAEWAPHFFRDLEAAKNSVLYAGVGVVGTVFLEIERTAFTMG